MSNRRSWFKLGYPAAVIFFLNAPLAIIMLYSFNDSKLNAVWNGFTLQWYVSLFENRQLSEALFNSLIIASVSTVIATALGTSIAFATRKYTRRWSGAVRNLVYMPIVIPDIMLGISLLVLFSKWSIPLGKLTMIAAHATFSLSFVYVIVAARLEGYRETYEEAARDLGAGPWQTFRYITLPLISPAIIAGALIAFTLSLDDFVVSFFVSGPSSTTVPLYIYALVKKGVSPEINALCTIMIVFTLALVGVAEWTRNRK